MNYGIKLEDREIIGLEICEKYRPFDIAFLDGDHRKEAVKQDLILLSRYIRHRREKDIDFLRLVGNT
ncbi:hypothetical protein [Dapis sp. BLCC M229]|uniref:hypothetical protein n=1 Tax=Dapis sp. BLCC M229 TaxID=3400188 RepID=UPI003CF040F7